MLRAMKMCRLSLDYRADFIDYLPCLGNLRSAPLLDEFMELSRQPRVEIVKENEGNAPNAYIILSTVDVVVGNTLLPLLGPVLLRALLDGGCSDLGQLHHGISHQDHCVPHSGEQGDVDDD